MEKEFSEIEIDIDVVKEDTVLDTGMSS